MLEKNMKSRLLALSCAAVLAAAPHTAAAQQPDDPSLISLFTETCTRGAVTTDGIVAGISETADWVEEPSPSIDLAQMAQVPGNSIADVAFNQPESVRQWQRQWNGRQVTLVYATFPVGATHRNVCALIVPETRNASPYFAPLAEAMQPIGLTPRLTNVPHHQEYSGRLRDMRRARAEIFSRSRTIAGGRNIMHLYIGFD
jgi:hypothetical protein